MPPRCCVCVYCASLPSPPLCLWFLSESLPTDDVSNFDVIPAIIGLQGFFPLKGQAAMGIGSMEAPASERRRLAKLYVGRTSIQQFLLPFFIVKKNEKCRLTALADHATGYVLNARSQIASVFRILLKLLRLLLLLMREVVRVHKLTIRLRRLVRKGGAEVIWMRPPPKRTGGANRLRTQTRKKGRMRIDIMRQLSRMRELLEVALRARFQLR